MRSSHTDSKRVRKLDWNENGRKRGSLYQKEGTENDSIARVQAALWYGYYNLK